MRASGKIGLLLFAGLGLSVAGVGSSDAQAKKKKPEPVLWAANEIKWVDLPELKGAKQAVLWGDPKKGAHGVLMMWPGGLTTPRHTHTRPNKGVVVSGTVVLTLDNQPPKELGPGSYLFMPGQLPHVTACKPGADCVFFSEQPGPSDFKVAPVPGQAPAPAAQPKGKPAPAKPKAKPAPAKPRPAPAKPKPAPKKPAARPTQAPTVQPGGVTSPDPVGSPTTGTTTEPQPATTEATPAAAPTP